MTTYYLEIQVLLIAWDMPWLKQSSPSLSHQPWQMLSNSLPGIPSPTGVYSVICEPISVWASLRFLITEVDSTGVWDGKAGWGGVACTWMVRLSQKRSPKSKRHTWGSTVDDFLHYDENNPAFLKSLLPLFPAYCKKQSMANGWTGNPMRKGVMWERGKQEEENAPFDKNSKIKKPQVSVLIDRLGLLFIHK